jgi:hypothetical protein
VIGLNGQFAMPGFIEGHGHFTGIGENKINLDLVSTTSWDQIVQMVAQAVEKAKPGQWIIGRGWHQEKWTAAPQPDVQGFPSTNRSTRSRRQSGGAHACERPCVVRQREGDGAVEHHSHGARSERRRDLKGHEPKSDRAPARDRILAKISQEYLKISRTRAVSRQRSAVSF